MTDAAPTLIYGSICSGHCAPSQAWVPLGWQPAFFAEVDAFACGVLAHRFRASAPQHYLDPASLPPLDRKTWIANNRELDRMRGRGEFGDAVANLGDFTKIDPADWRHVQIVIGGTPCQDFSIAGGRIGLAGHRGNLSLAFIGLLHDLAATGSLRLGVWENVPGVLSDRKNAFGCFLGALVGHDAPIVSPHGKGRWTDAGVVVGPVARAAWRILDAQHFGLAQRRRRLFVVVSFGDGPDPVEILFERQGVPGFAASRSGAREDVAPTLAARTRGGGGFGTDAELDGAQRAVCVSEVTHTLRGEGFDASEDGTGRGTPLGPMASLAFGASGFADYSEGIGTLRANGGDIGPGSEALVDDQRLAFGGNNQSGPINVATARSGHAGPHGRCDFETETFIVEPKLFSAMPMNSGKDFTVREVSTAQPIMAAGPVGGNQGGDYVLQPEPIPLLEAGARTGKSTSDIRAGSGIGDPGDPMFTLQAGKQHGVLAASPIAFSCKDDGRDATVNLSPTLRAMNHSGSHPNAGGQLAVAFDTTQITSAANRSNPKAGDKGHPLTAEGHAPAVAFSLRGRDGENEIEPEAGNVAPALRAGDGGSSKSFVATSVTWAVRRLLPHECERLQGTQDGFTMIAWRGAPAAECPDGVRYKIIGNSMAVNVISWLGQRIEKAWFK